MFRCLKFYSPTGAVKHVPMTQANMSKYFRFLQLRRKKQPQQPDGEHTTRVKQTCEYATANHLHQQQQQPVDSPGSNIKLLSPEPE